MYRNTGMALAELRRKEAGATGPCHCKTCVRLARERGTEPYRPPEQIKAIVCLRCGTEAAVSTKTHSSICPACMKSHRDKAERARSLVAELVAQEIIPAVGTLKCVDCGADAKHYDHRDYDDPANVEPVCHGCNLARGQARS